MTRIISALKQEAYEFKASLGHIEDTASNKTKLKAGIMVATGNRFLLNYDQLWFFYKAGYGPPGTALACFSCYRV